MEELVLEAEEQLAVPELGEFRSFVDDHCTMWRKRDELFVKVLYVLGARVSELLTKVTPWQLANNKTKPYGQLLTWELSNYKKNDGSQVKLLLVKSAVAKHAEA